MVAGDNCRYNNKKNIKVVAETIHIPKINGYYYNIFGMQIYKKFNKFDYKLSDFE